MNHSGAVVDIGRCGRLGEFLKALEFPAAARIDLPGDLTAPDLRMLYFAVVAICHQTSPIGKPRLEGLISGEFLGGWDYLRACWIRAAKADPAILTREWLMSCAPSDVVYILYDHERRCGSNITDPEGRAALLRNIGAVMYRDGVRHVDEYYQRSEGWLQDRGSQQRGPYSLFVRGLESALSRFEAYGKDPVKKKLNYFLILMNRYGFWNYSDIQNLGAPVDYHEMRLHLRLGTVKIIDPELAEKVAEGAVLNSTEDVKIRSAVLEAIFKIAESSGRTPADLHNFFWNMARNCCRRDETHCISCGNRGKHPSLPSRHEALLRHSSFECDSGYSCVFNDHCASAALPHYEKPKEPVVDTDLY